MEPAQTKVVFFSKVIATFEKLQPIWLGGVGDNAKFEDKPLGWFVHLQGSFEALHVGMEEPTLKPGDKVKITLEKVT